MVPIRFALILALAALVFGPVQAGLGAAGQPPNLLLNGDFSQWADGAPPGWRWRDAPPNANIIAEERLGKPVMSVRRPNALFQDVDELPLRKDDRVVFEGFVRTGEANMAFADITLDYGERHDRALMRSQIPGGGWHYLRIVIRVPHDEPDNIRFAIHMRDEMQSPLLLSNMQAYAIPGMP